MMTKRKILHVEYLFSEALAVKEDSYRIINIKSKSRTAKRIESIDLLRGVVMIIMALDHVRDYFSRDAFYYDPTDLAQTSVPLFFTRFITHYCATVFIFLAGISACLYGAKKRRKELAYYLFSRGLWLVFVELFIVSLFRTFNLAYTYVNLQVIWAIGICMMILSVVIYMPKRFILFTGVVLIAWHNMLDTVHVQGDGMLAFVWSVLHDARHFNFGDFSVYVRYPVLPWLGVMMFGYYMGSIYTDYKAEKRKRVLLIAGVASIILFVLLRAGNWYGDAATWSVQKDTTFSLLSFLNVTKYPPSLLYILITLGPALVFLALAEKPLNAFTKKIVVFGRVPMFYYLAHILLIHIAASIVALITGYNAMLVLTMPVFATPGLKGFGFSLIIVYAIWFALLLFLYPFCKWFEGYKREHQYTQQWLSYL